MRLRSMIKVCCVSFGCAFFIQQVGAHETNELSSRVFHLSSVSADEHVTVRPSMPIGRLPSSIDLSVSNLPGGEPLNVKIDAIPPPAGDGGVGAAEFSVSLATARSRMLTIDLGSGDEVKFPVPGNSGLDLDYINLSTLEDGNGVYSFNLLFGYDPARKTIVLKNTVLAIRVNGCDHSLMALYDVKDDSLIGMPLVSFDSGRVFSRLRELYVSSPSAAFTRVKLMPYEMSERLKRVADLYRRKDVENFKAAVAEFIFDGGASSVCDAPEYVLDAYFYPDTIQWSNDLGFYFAQAEYYDEAVVLLQKVVSTFPTRVPAYLNLADALWGRGQQQKSVEYYQEYRSRMVQKGMSNKIPSRVEERLGTGR